MQSEEDEEEEEDEEQPEQTEGWSQAAPPLLCLGHGHLYIQSLIHSFVSVARTIKPQ